jgi:hypothetical protein
MTVFLIVTGIIGVLALAIAFLTGRHIYQMKRLPLREYDREQLAQEHAQEMERERLVLIREKHEHDLQLAQERHALELRMQWEDHELQKHLALTRIQADNQGHYPYYIHQNGFMALPNVNMRQLTQKTEEAAAPDASTLVASGMSQPTQRYLIEQLEENALQVCPGVRTSDGQPVILSIPDAVHFKLIGSSGFGKSCLAAAILEQAIKLNSPDVLQIALLDLEHKTSRLFEHSPNVATLQIGRRSVPMVAMSADEVASHLGLLKKELDRRALLSEYDLQGEPLLLIYVEEMLSLQFEVDESLIVQMLKDLSVLAVRARKYNMFLLACAQTDYSTPELKTAQKQFRSRIAFAIDTTAARAAGFMSTDLIKYSFSHSQRGDGMYVLETPGVASLMLAPVYDVRAKVLALDTRSVRVQAAFNAQPLRVVNSERTPSEHHLNTPEHPLQAKRTQVEQLRSHPYNWQKIAIIEKVWNVKRGGSQGWKQAEAEYTSIVAEIAAEEREV